MQTGSSNSITIDMEPKPETRQLVDTIRAGVQSAKAVTVITTPQEYEWAAEQVIACNSAVKKLTDQRMAITRPMDEAKRQVMELFEKPIKAAEAIVAHCKRLMVAFDAEQDRRRREEQERLRREAEEKAAAERAEADRVRREAEAKERAEREAAEAARRQAEADARRAQEAGDAEAAAKAQADAEAAVQRDLAAAQAAEDARAQAAAIESTADMIEATPAQAMTEAAPDVDGIQKRANWKGEVTDFHALIRAAAAGLDNGNATIALMLEPNAKAIGAIAKSSKGSLAVPGIRFFNDPVIAASRRG